MLNYVSFSADQQRHSRNLHKIGNFWVNLTVQSDSLEFMRNERSLKLISYIPSLAVETDFCDICLI